MLRGKLSRLMCGVLLVAGYAAKTGPALAADGEVEAAIAAIRRVGPKGEGNAAASRAAKLLSQAGPQTLVPILAGMDKAGPLAENWLRGAFEAIAERSLREKKLPQTELEGFLLETSNSPRARRLAYEWIVRADAAAPERLMPKMVDDPSLELRRDAVQRIIDAATKAEEDAAIPVYQEALKHARDLDQVKVCTDALEKLKSPVDTARHLGFLSQWKLIGPFDNTEKKGFAVAYPPESEIKLDATYPGKLGEVKWFDHATTDGYGVVDLTKALDKHKGAVAYASAEFDSDGERDVQLRLGSINANKLWLNGKLLFENEIYHAGINIDQYIAEGRLQAGKNVILIKICQNEQTESWAQDWKFQLRVTDSLGGAVASK